MRRLMPNKDTENFNLALAEIKKAGAEIKRANKEIEAQKQEVKDGLDDLLALIDNIPTTED